jgi:hypothetical protein
MIKFKSNNTYVMIYPNCSIREFTVEGVTETHATVKGVAFRITVRNNVQRVYPLGLQEPVLRANAQVQETRSGWDD